MDDQASVSGGRTGGENGRSDTVVGGLAEFVNDVSGLAELQWKLASLDLGEAKQHALVPLGLAVGGAAVLAGCIPVAVAGAALLIASATGLSIALSLLLTAAAVMVVAGFVAVYAARRLGRSLEIFRRSQEELQRNISWIRTVLVHSGRAAPRRRW